MSQTPPEENREASNTSRALLHELAEALTAIQSYVAGARHLAHGQRSEVTTELADALERLSEEVQRATDVLRRFRIALRSLDTG